MDRKAFLAEAQAWIDGHAEEMISELQTFARIRSVSRADLAEEGAPFGPECAHMLAFALKRAEEMGFRTENHAGHCGSVILGDGDNAIGVFAHLDVVPEGDKWIYPPYAATREGDFLFGRGVSDNKSAAVMTLYLMRMFKELGTPLRHGVRLVLGCSEETGMQDMEYFVKNVPQPVFSLVPDAGFPCNYAQKGSMTGRMRIPKGDQIVSFEGGEVDNMVPPSATALIKGVSPDALKAAFAQLPPELAEDLTVLEEEGCARINARGVAAHAASPENGKSAVHTLAEALSRSGLLSGESRKAAESIADMTSDFHGGKAGIACEDPDSGLTTMNIGVARTEEGGTIRLHLDCRLSIAADQPANIAAYQAYARSLGFDPYQVSTTKPVYVPKDDPRITALQEIYLDLTGDPAEPYTMGGGTYARCFDNAISFGLGFPANRVRPEGLPEGHGGAHSPDEYLHIPSLLKAAAIYACTIPALDEII